MDFWRRVLMGIDQEPLVWTSMLASWGGIIAYLNRITEQKIPFSLLRFVAEMLTSSFVGVLVYFFCQSMGVSQTMTACLVGISGHMGTRALIMLEQYYTRVVVGGKK